MRTEVLALKDPLVSAESTADVASGFVALESLTVVDFAVVNEKHNGPPDHPAAVNPKHWWKQPWVGNLAQWTIIVITLGVAIGTRSCEHAAKDFDRNVDTRIDGKLKPFGTDLNGRLDKLGEKLDDVRDRLGRIEQWKVDVEGRVRLQSRQQMQLNDDLAQQQAITRLYDPNRILATIRAEIQMANARNGTLPASQLADYRNALRALPSSTVDYWQTVAAVINYQSLLNQMSHEAPDPAKVARPCIDENWIGNFIANHTFRNCIVSLDTNSFYNVTFQDSVIQYRGGGVELSDVKFVNCTFKLELTTQPVKPAQEKLLLAILNSNDQKAVRISR
jgi:hypothetical protein